MAAKPSLLRFVLSWLIITLSLLALGTFLASNGSNTPARWLAAQRSSPLLWLYDGVVPLLAAFALLPRSGKHFAAERQRGEESRRLLEEQQEQLDGMRKRAEEDDARYLALQASLEAQAAQTSTHARELAQQTEALARQEAERVRQHTELAQTVAEARARQGDLLARAQRLAEQTVEVLQGDVSAQSRQLEAVNLALQHHRSEITQLRRRLQSGNMSSDPARMAQLTPDELAAMTATTAFLPQLPSSFVPAASENREAESSFAGTGPSQVEPFEEPAGDTDPSAEYPAVLAEGARETVLAFDEPEEMAFAETTTSGGYTVVAPTLHFEVESFDIPEPPFLADRRPASLENKAAEPAGPEPELALATPPAFEAAPPVATAEPDITPPIETFAAEDPQTPPPHTWDINHAADAKPDSEGQTPDPLARTPVSSLEPERGADTGHTVWHIKI